MNNNGFFRTYLLQTNPVNQAFYDFRSKVISFDKQFSIFEFSLYGGREITHDVLVIEYQNKIYVLARDEFKNTGIEFDNIQIVQTSFGQKSQEFWQSIRNLQKHLDNYGFSGREIHYNTSQISNEEEFSGLVEEGLRFLHCSIKSRSPVFIIFAPRILRKSPDNKREFQVVTGKQLLIGEARGEATKAEDLSILQLNQFIEYYDNKKRRSSQKNLPVALKNAQAVMDEIYGCFEYEEIVKVLEEKKRDCIKIAEEWINKNIRKYTKDNAENLIETLLSKNDQFKKTEKFLAGLVLLQPIRQINYFNENLNYSQIRILMCDPKYVEKLRYAVEQDYVDIINFESFLFGITATLQQELCIYKEVGRLIQQQNNQKREQEMKSKIRIELENKNKWKLGLGLWLKKLIRSS